MLSTFAPGENVESMATAEIDQNIDVFAFRRVGCKRETGSADVVDDHCCCSCSFLYEEDSSMSSRTTSPNASAG